MLNSDRPYVDLISVQPRNIPPGIQSCEGQRLRQKNGTFVREGNIYLDGSAEKYRIAAPVQYGRDSVGQAWITSLNATQGPVSLHPLIAQCNAKAAFRFSSGLGAVFATENSMVTIIDPPGALKGLLENPACGTWALAQIGDFLFAIPATVRHQHVGYIDLAILTATNGIFRKEPCAFERFFNIGNGRNQVTLLENQEELYKEVARLHQMGWFLVAFHKRAQEAYIEDSQASRHPLGYRPILRTNSKIF
ncbi:hypothetical protein B0H14DRAFT_2600048 [Mycena olivaceomarginata]|nr:hypothetical protein B0H14DRAFT_2600048 [Mycena olivaceomarginata]